MTDLIKTLIDTDKLRMKVHTDAHTQLEYTIVNYKDDKVDEFPETGLYKSLIFKGSTPDLANLVSFSPPHSVEYETFKDKYPDLSCNDMFVANEVVEGTMFSIFFDDRENKWEMATRSAVGGHNWYFRTQYPGITIDEVEQPTFREMFIDALLYDNKEKYNPELSETLFQTAMNAFSRDLNYCMVLQHPANALVFDVIKPTLYLVAIYDIKRIRETEMGNVCPLNIYAPENASKLSTVVLPKRYCVGKNTGFSARYDEFECIFRDAENSAGMMFTNIINGERTMMKNDEYEKLRELRGNHPNLQYHFYELHKNGKLLEFLDAFPRYRVYFQLFYDQLIHMSYMVYGAYRNYFILKRRDSIPKKYFIHAARIHHDIYIPAMTEKKTVHITPLIVRQYFEAMDPGKIVYYLNYDTNKPDTQTRVESEPKLEAEQSFTC